MASKKRKTGKNRKAGAKPVSKSHPVKSQKIPKGYKAVEAPTRKSRGRSLTFYRDALRGRQYEPDAPRTLGLRDVMGGFDSRDGFRLNDLQSLTPSQKRKITKAANVLAQWTAQTKRVYKPKTKAKLAKAVRILEMPKRYKWRIALVPGIPQFTKKGKEKAPSVSFPDDDVMRINQGDHFESKLHFDLSALMRNPRAEVQRLLDLAPKAKRFKIAVGPNLITMGEFHNRDYIAQRVISLMNQYDGNKNLPRGSGNAGDAPSAHKYDKWLSGLVAFEFKRTDAGTVARVNNKMNAENAKLRKAKRAAKARAAYAKRKKRK